MAECDCCSKRVIEIKCPYNLSAESEKNMKMSDLDWIPLKETHDYYYQIQMQMLCVNVQLCDFVVWSENECKILRYSRNALTCSSIINKCTGYFHNAVLPELLAKFHSRKRKMLVLKKALTDVQS